MNHRNPRHIRALALMTASSLGMCIARALAADADTAQEQPQAKQLDTVVVTATKREKPLQDVPASITALSGEDLEQRNAQSMDDIVKLVPGLTLSKPVNNAEHVTIRGISSEANTNPTTGILFGDTSFTDSYVPIVTLDQNPFDMEQVEVLKGPQGTLFGASALNGAIRYTPVEPNFDGFGGKYYVEDSIVHEGTHSLAGGVVLNIPFNDALALRIMDFRRQVPGWIDNTLTGQKNANRGFQNGFRGILALRPSEDLNIKLTYANQDTTIDDAGSADNYAGQLKDRIHPLASPGNTRYELGNINVDWDFGSAHLVSDTSGIRKRFWYFNDETYNNLPIALAQQVFGSTPSFITNTGTSKSNTISQEFRLVSDDAKDSRFSWVVGISGSKQDISRHTGYYLGNSSLPDAVNASVINLISPGFGNAWLALGKPAYNHADIDVTVKELALFFDTTWKFADDWDLGLGGRWYRTTSGGTVDNSGLLMYATGYPNGYLIDDTLKQSGFNPKVSMTWHANEQVNYYVSASKGFRVGGLQWGTVGTNAGSPAPDIFKSDYIWNYELGMRARWLDNTLSLDATVFHEDWKNPQVLVLDPGTLTAYVDNVGQVKSDGIEAALQYLFPFGLRFGVSAAYTDTRTAQPFTADSGQVVPKGTTWPMAPKWQTAATLDYELFFGNWNFGASISDAYIGAATYGITQSDKIGNYSLLDAQVRIANTRWWSQPELSLGVTNAADKRGLNTAYSGPTWISAGYVQPRTIDLRLSGHF